MSSPVTFDTLCLSRHSFPRSGGPSRIWKPGQLVMDVIPGASGTGRVATSVCSCPKAGDPPQCPARECVLVAFGPPPPALLAPSWAAPAQSPGDRTQAGVGAGGGARARLSGCLPARRGGWGGCSPFSETKVEWPPWSPRQVGFCLSLSLCKLQP